MTRNLRLRWLILILLLECTLLFSFLSVDALVNGLRFPFNPLGSQDISSQAFPPVSKPAVVLPPPLPQAPLKAPENFKTVFQCLFQDASTLKIWEEKTFKGGTKYEVLQENGEGFLKSKSEGSCSGLYVQLDHPVTPDLYVSWKWRALAFPKKKHPESTENKNEDDYAARVYVIFPGTNFFKSDVIEYIWDEHLPPDTVAPSPYSSRIKLYILRSGPASTSDGGWLSEQRNVYEDYQKLYGKAPDKPVGAIALMSDSDNTGTSSEADFSNIALKIKT